MPDETLKLGRTIRQLRRSLREDLVGLGLVHVVSHSLAALMCLVPGNKATGEGIVFLELIVASEVVIAEHTSDGEILRTSVEDDSGGLTDRSAHVHRTEIDGIISAVEGHLELQVILVIDRGVGDLTDELGLMDASVSSLLVLGLKQILFDFGSLAIIFLSVQTAGTLLLGLGELVALSLLDIELSLSSLKLSQLRVVKLITVDHDGFLLVEALVRRAINYQVDISSLFQLDVIVVVNDLALKINSKNVATGVNGQSIGLERTGRDKCCHGKQTHLEEGFGHFV